MTKEKNDKYILIDLPIRYYDKWYFQIYEENRNQIERFGNMEIINNVLNFKAALL